MKIIKPGTTAEWVLRVGIFMTFLGHGFLAVIGNPHWIDYIQTVGFKEDTAQYLLIVIGWLDIFVATYILLKPNKYIVLWAFLWAFSTALIRPISGESIWIFIEKGANWAAPLALYFFVIREKVKL